MRRRNEKDMRLTEGGARIVSETSISSGLVSGRNRYFRPITSGVVLDHIPAGGGIMIRLLLGVSKESPTVSHLVENLDSKRLGRKDAIVLDGRFPPEEVLWAISFLWPEITINVMRDGVHSKLKYDAPVRATAVSAFRCPNADCDSHRDPEVGTRSRFSVIPGQEEEASAECVCCGRKFTREEILAALGE